MRAILASVFLVSVAMVSASQATEQEPTVQLSSGCEHEGRHLEVGESFEDACKWCWCPPGSSKVSCVEVQCDFPICPENMRIETRPGDCCPSCVDI